MDQFLTLTIIGLCTAGIFAVAASGLVLTYSTTGIFNFAHGAIGMVGAFTYWQLREAWGLPSALAVVLILLVIAPAFGALLDLVVLRGLDNAPDATRLVVSIAVLAATLGLGLWIWSPDESRPLRSFWQGEQITVAGVNVTYHEAFAFVCAVAVAVGLRVLLTRTRAGIAMRATVDDRGLARLVGSRATRSSLLAWALGCSLAALAGILIAPQQTLSHTRLTLLIVNAYAAAVFGKLRSLPLAFAGAIVLGLADAYGTGYLPTDNQYLTQFRAAIPVLLLFVALLALPQARLRVGARRSRESFPRPTWRGSTTAAVGLVLVVAAVAPLLTDADALRASRIFGIGIVALSLVPLVGYAGQISLCQMSFAAIGAITASQVANGSPLGIVAGALVAAAVGVLVALPALRLSGIYLALATGAFAVVLDRWIFLLPAFDIGPVTVRFFELGSVQVERLRLPGIDPSDPRVWLVEGAVLFTLLAIGVVALRRSRFGERLLAMKESPAACATLGMGLTRTKLAVFATSAGIAGVGGAVYGGSLGAISPEQFSFFESLPVLLVAVAGSIGSAGGAVFAGIVLAGIPIVAASLPSLTDPLRILPGLIGISLARDPNGAIRGIQLGYAPLAADRIALGATLAAIVGLWVLAITEVLSGWQFGLLVVLALLVAPGVATSRATRRARATAEVDSGDAVADEVPLEYVGIARPYTADDVAAMDAALALPPIAAPVGAGSSR